MKRINLHIVLNTFINDNRVLRETRAIASNGLFQEVHICALWADGLRKSELLDDKRFVRRIRLITKKLPTNIFFQALKYIELLIRILWIYRGNEIPVVQCHNVSALPIGIIFKLFKKSKVVYDAHELETEVFGLSGIRKRVKKSTEKLLMKKVDTLIVVSDSIAAWYKKEYQVLRNVNIVLNIPDNTGSVAEFDGLDCNLKRKYKIGDTEILYIYQGGLVRGRYLEILLETFTKLNGVAHIVFMGKGLLEGLIYEYQNKYCNIHFHQAVEPEKVVQFTRTADVGITLAEGKWLSRYYALPNKLFEYLMSGLPVIVNNLPERAKIIENYECGWIIGSLQEGEMDSLVNLIRGISRRDIDEKKGNVGKVLIDYNWKNEEKKLCNIYKGLLP